MLEREWKWVDIVKPPQIKTIPDILTPAEVENLIGATRKLRYRVFLLSTYSMGLRLGEALALQVGDIDAARKRVHIRRGKGHKDRLVPLPDLTLIGLRELWERHRHPKLIFPNANGSFETIRQAKTHEEYYDAFLARYRDTVLPGQLNALNAMRDCRTSEAGELYVKCSACGHTEFRPLSCGHRSCPQCQNHETSRWIDRQQNKLLPGDVYIAL